MARLPAHRVLIAAGVFRLRLALAGRRLGRGFAGLTGWRAGRSGRTAGAAGIRDAASESASGGRPVGMHMLSWWPPAALRRRAGVKVNPFLDLAA